MRPLTKIHGGKGRLAKPFIVPNLPSGYEQMTYCEPFCGMASVLLKKNKSKREILLDEDFLTIYLLSICKSFPSSLYHSLCYMAYNEITFNYYKGQNPIDIYDQAIKKYVLSRMSRGGLGETFAWQERLRGGQPGSINEWKTSLDNIWLVSDRLKDVEIYCQSFEESIPLYDSVDTLFYCDPPYVKSTRSCPNIYNHEMDESAHTTLLELLCSIKGKALVSGYSSKLYHDKLKGWNRVEKIVANNSGQNAKKQLRTEVLWMNY